MKKIVLSIFALLLGVFVVTAGCEVQPPSSQNPRHSELESSVAAFASSIDPYEKYSRSEVYAMLEEFMYAHPEVYASGLAVAGSMNTINDFYYIYKDGTTFVTIDGFDYGSVDKGVLESLQNRVATGEQFWSQPYSREDGSGSTITVSTLLTPIVNDSGNVKYILTVDQIEESK